MKEALSAVAGFGALVHVYFLTVNVVFISQRKFRAICNTCSVFDPFVSYLKTNYAVCSMASDSVKAVQNFKLVTVLGTFCISSWPQAFES